MFVLAAFILRILSFVNTELVPTGERLSQSERFTRAYPFVCVCVCASV